MSDKMRSKIPSFQVKSENGKHVIYVDGEEMDFPVSELEIVITPDKCIATFSVPLACVDLDMEDVAFRMKVKTPEDSE